MRVSLGRGREEDECKVLRERVKPSRRRLLAQQTVVGAALGSGKKVVAMWQLPHSITNEIHFLLQLILCNLRLT